VTREGGSDFCDDDSRDLSLPGPLEQATTMSDEIISRRWRNTAVYSSRDTQPMF
jgi:hypothetical protein